MPNILNYEESAIIRAIRERVQTITDYLFSSYLIYDIRASDDELEVKAQRTDDKNGMTIVLKLRVDHGNRRVGITNIFIPQEFLQNAHGKTIISNIFSVAAEAGYALLLLDVMLGFHRRLATRGATVIDDDTIQITERTRLTP